MPEGQKVRKSGTQLKLIVSKIAISVLLLAFLTRWVDYTQIARAALAVQKRYFFISFAFVLLGEALIAVRLRELLRPTRLRVPLFALLKAVLVAKFYAVFLPAGIGQAAARWYKVTRNEHGRFQFALVTVIEKAMFLAITLISGGVALFLSTDPRVAQLRATALPVVVLLFLALTSLYLLLMADLTFTPFDRFKLRVMRRVTERFPRTGDFSAEFRTYRGRQDVVLRAFGLSLVIQVALLFRIGLLFGAVAVSLPWHVVIWVCAFAIFVQAMPVSFAGIGVREAAFAYAFTINGLDPEAGALVGLLFFAQVLISAFIGGILDLTDKREVISAR